MEHAVESRLQSVQFGEPQIHRSIAIVPLIAPVDGTFQYHTIGEALAAGDLVITEISANGSVPKLLVVIRTIKAAYDLQTSVVQDTNIPAILLLKEFRPQRNCGYAEAISYQNRRCGKCPPTSVGGLVSVVKSYATPSAFPRP